MRNEIDAWQKVPWTDTDKEMQFAIEFSMQIWDVLSNIFPWKS